MIRTKWLLTLNTYIHASKATLRARLPTPTPVSVYPPLVATLGAGGKLIKWLMTMTFVLNNVI